MTKLEGMTNENGCHPEHSAAESKDPATLPKGMATGRILFRERPAHKSKEFCVQVGGVRQVHEKQ
jgi:hypothetical protein